MKGFFQKGTVTRAIRFERHRFVPVGLVMFFLCGMGIGGTLHAAPTEYVPAPEKSLPAPARHPLVQDGDPVYRVTLCRDGDLAGRFAITGSLRELQDGVRRHPEAVVRVSRRRKGDDTFWNLEVVPADGYGVFEVEFPILKFHEISGPAHDRLVIGRQSGSVIRNPFAYTTREGRPHHYEGGVVYSTYGSTRQGMQYLLFENGREGVMLWTQDAAGRAKDFDVSRKLPEEDLKRHCLRASVHHFPETPGQPGTAWKAPYPVVVSTYRDGWYEAAGKYRQWAMAQPWMQQGSLLERVERGELPEWYRRNVMWLFAVDHTSEKALRQYLELFPEVEFGVFLTQWQKNPFDTGTPDYLPPKNPRGMRALMALQPQRLHMFPYMNVQSYNPEWDFSKSAPAFRRLQESVAEPPPVPLLDAKTIANIPHYRFYQEFWGRNVPKTTEIVQALEAAWQGPVDESLLRRIESDWFTVYSYEKQPLLRKLRTRWGKDPAIPRSVVVKNRMAPLCRAAPQWRNLWLKMASELLNDYQSDGLYFDQLLSGTVWYCWSPRHGHAPGINGTYLNGNLQLLQDSRKLAAKKVLFAEAYCEYYVGNVEETHGQIPEFYRHEQIPFFQTVYHGYISHWAWALHPGAMEDMNDFAAAFSQMLHRGYKIGFISMVPYLKMLQPDYRACLEYTRKAAALLLRSADTVVYGQRLKDPELAEVPWQKVTYFCNASGTQTREVVRPAVTASLWRSLQGDRTAVLLSNDCDREVRVVLRSEEIPAGVRFQEVLAPERGVVSKDGGELTVTLPPFSLNVLENAATRP